MQVRGFFLGGHSPWACSSSLASSSEWGGPAPPPALARLRDKIPEGFSITDGIARGGRRGEPPEPPGGPLTAPRERGSAPAPPAKL